MIRKALQKFHGFMTNILPRPDPTAENGMKLVVPYVPKWAHGFLFIRKYPEYFDLPKKSIFKLLKKGPKPEGGEEKEEQPTGVGAPTELPVKPTTDAHWNAGMLKFIFPPAYVLSDIVGRAGGLYVFRSANDGGHQQFSNTVYQTGNRVEAVFLPMAIMPNKFQINVMCHKTKKSAGWIVQDGSKDEQHCRKEGK